MAASFSIDSFLAASAKTAASCFTASTTAARNIDDDDVVDDDDNDDDNDDDEANSSFPFAVFSSLVPLLSPLLFSLSIFLKSTSWPAVETAVVVEPEMKPAVSENPRTNPRFDAVARFDAANFDAVARFDDDVARFDGDAARFTFSS